MWKGLEILNANEIVPCLKIVVKTICPIVFVMKQMSDSDFLFLNITALTHFLQKKKKKKNDVNLFSYKTGTRK